MLCSIIYILCALPIYTYGGVLKLDGPDSKIVFQDDSVEITAQVFKELQDNVTALMAWKEQSENVGTEQNPAQSCQAILQSAPAVSLASGLYTFKDSSGIEYKAYCDFDLEDGVGWMLIAKFKGGHYRTGGVSFLQAEELSTSGGTPKTDAWAPTLTTAGHINFNRISPSGRTFRMTCGTNANNKHRDGATYTTTLFQDWNGGYKGNRGAAGSPGWVVIAGKDTNGNGYSSHWICGSRDNPEITGVGFCSGNPGGGVRSVHLASYTDYRSQGIITCRGSENNDSGSDYGVNFYVK